MKARPILFSAPMVRALLAGTKTQSRRAVKPQLAGALEALGDNSADVHIRWGQIREDSGRLRAHEWLALCAEYPEEGAIGLGAPYGDIGDLLWVREAWSADWPEVGYRAGGARFFEGTEHDVVLRALYDRQRGEWRPSIYMPRWASRLTLRITDVRVQRLQEITEADARAEGIVPRLGGFALEDTTHYAGRARESYASLWEAINGPGDWDANPWVWALSFQVLRNNVDQVLQEAA